jgi:hypothetical protein
MLAISPARLREVAGPLRFRPLNGRWDVDDVKKIAVRVVVIGSVDEIEAAKNALKGPLRAPIDPKRFNDWDDPR